MTKQMMIKRSLYTALIAGVIEGVVIALFHLQSGKIPFIFYVINIIMGIVFANTRMKMEPEGDTLKESFTKTLVLLVQFLFIAIAVQAIIVWIF